MGGRCLACKEDLELEQKIQELQERRRELRTRMNVNHDPFILKLPPEVASHIFLLSMGARDAYKVSGNGLPTPFLLGAVCRGWRQLARSTPRLWSTLDFNLTDSMDALPHLVADWLERSGGLPLTLKVYYSDRGSDLLKKRYIPVIDTLNEHSGRWFDVKFVLPPAYLHHLRGSSPAKNLCDLSISNPSFKVGDISP